MLVKFTVQKHRLTKTVRPNHRTIEHFPSHTPHHHITKGLLTAVPFTQYTMSGYQDKVTRHNKRQKTQLEEPEQASDPDKEGMLELSDQELETTMTNIVRALMIK